MTVRFLKYWHQVRCILLRVSSYWYFLFVMTWPTMYMTGQVYFLASYYSMGSQCVLGMYRAGVTPGVSDVYKVWHPLYMCTGWIHRWFRSPVHQFLRTTDSCVHIMVCHSQSWYWPLHGKLNNILCISGISRVSDSNPYSGVKLPSWTFRWYLKL